MASLGVQNTNPGNYQGDMSRNMTNIDQSFNHYSRTGVGLGLNKDDLEMAWGKAPYPYPLTDTLKVDNFVTSVRDLWKNENMTQASILLDTAFVIQQYTPILSIVAPYLKTEKQTSVFKVMILNIQPAEKTMPGTQNKTNSISEMSYASTTQMYGINCYMPVSVLHNPKDLFIRRNLTIYMMALSLSIAFVQILLQFFMVIGVINTFVESRGYDLNTRNVQPDITFATDKRDVGCGNDGLINFLQVASIPIQGMMYARRRLIFMILPPNVITSMTQYLKSATQIKELDVYSGTVADINDSIINAVRHSYKLPSGTTLYQIAQGANGQNIVIVPTPSIPLSPQWKLPNPLECRISIPQFYTAPQSEKPRYAICPQTALLHIYDQPEDKDIPIAPSDFMRHSGMWETSTGEWTKSYIEMVYRYGKQPSITDINKLKDVREITSSFVDKIPYGHHYEHEFVGSYFEKRYGRARLASEFHSISEGTYPNSQLIQTANEMREKDSDTASAVLNLLRIAREQLKTPPSEELINWIYDSNKERLRNAGPTPMDTLSKHATWSPSAKDLGSINFDLKMLGDEDKILADGGLAHCINDFIKCRNSGTSGIGNVARDMASAIKQLDDALSRSKTQIQKSNIFKRIPSWRHKMNDNATSIIASLGGGYPLFFKLYSPDFDKDKQSYDHLFRYARYRDLTKRMTPRDTEKPKFGARVNLVSVLESKGYSLFDATNKKLNQDVFTRVEYALNNGLDPNHDEMSVKSGAILLEKFLTPEASKYTYGGGEKKGSVVVKKLEDSEIQILKTLSNIATLLAFIQTKSSTPIDYDLFMKNVLDKSQYPDIKGLDPELQVIIRDEFDKLIPIIKSPDTDGSDAKKGQATMVMDEVYCRTPLAVLPSAFFDMQNNEGKNQYAWLGDPRTGYSTPITGTSAEQRRIIKEFIADEDTPLKSVVKEMTVSSVSIGEDAKFFERLTEREVPKAARGDEGDAAEAYGLRSFGKPGGKKDKITRGKDIYQATGFSDVSLQRFAHLQSMAHGWTPQESFFIQATLFMPTNLHVLGPLADSGVFVPFDFGGARNIFAEAASIILTSDFSAQAIIGRSYVNQIHDGYDDVFKAHAKNSFGFRPTVLDGTRVLRGAFINRILRGMTAKLTYPNRLSHKYETTTQDLKEASLLAFIYPTTYQIGDLMSWTNSNHTREVLTAARLNEATQNPFICPNLKYGFGAQCESFCHTFNRVSDARTKIVKRTWVGGGSQTFPDFTVAARLLGCTVVDNMITRGPVKYFTSPNHYLEVHGVSGAPISTFMHQRTGNMHVYSGKERYFNLESNTRRQGAAGN